MISNPVPPSPILEQKLRNTENLINTGNSHLVDSYAYNYPDEYVDLDTYYKIRGNIRGSNIRG